MLVMLTQLDVFKIGRGGRLILPSDLRLRYLPACLFIFPWRECCRRGHHYPLRRALGMCLLVTRLTLQWPFPQGSSLSFPRLGPGPRGVPSHLF